MRLRLGLGFGVNIPAETGVDTTPDPYSFANVFLAETRTVVVSETVMITGINAPAPVTISGEGSPKFKIDAGAWVTSGSIENGQDLTLRLTSSNYNSTTRQATVVVGGVPFTWSVTTEAGGLGGGGLP